MYSFGWWSQGNVSRTIYTYNKQQTGTNICEIESEIVILRVCVILNLTHILRITISFSINIVRTICLTNCNTHVTECIVCVQGHDPLTFFSCRPLSFLIGREFYGRNYLKCSNLRAGPATSSFPQCPCRSRSSFSVSCCQSTNASDSGKRACK